MRCACAVWVFGNMGWKRAGPTAWPRACSVLAGMHHSAIRIGTAPLEASGMAMHACACIDALHACLARLQGCAPHAGMVGHVGQVLGNSRHLVIVDQPAACPSHAPAFRPPMDWPRGAPGASCTCTCMRRPAAPAMSPSPLCAPRAERTGGKHLSAHSLKRRNRPTGPRPLAAATTGTAQARPAAAAAAASTPRLG